MCESGPVSTEFSADRLARFKRLNDGYGPEFFVPKLKSSPVLRKGVALSQEQIDAEVKTQGI